MKPQLFFISLFFLQWLFSHHISAQYVLPERYTVFEYPSTKLYHLQDKVRSTTTSLYLAKGDSASATKTTERGESYFNDYEYMEFDPDGRILVEGEIFKGNMIPAYTYVYDDNKQTLLIDHSTKYPDLNYKFELQYFPDRKSITLVESHATVPGINKTFIMYYKQDSLIDSMQILNAKKELSSTYRYVYDEKGNIKSCDMYGAGKSLREQHVYTYNKKGELTKDAYYLHNQLYSTKELYYDQYGNPTFQKGPDLNGAVRLKIRYAYDSKGNWIKRTLWVNGIPEEIDERVIQYY